MLKPSLIKTNARYRGPTELDKYLNSIHETVHDLRLLARTIDSNGRSLTDIGHREAIYSNMAYCVNGMVWKPIIKVPTVTTFCSTDSEIEMQFQNIGPTDVEDKSIKGRISNLESEICFLLENL